MSVITPRVVNYAAQECYWQRSGEMSVAWMIEAWRRADRRRWMPITVGHVLALGKLVEPSRNAPGFRRHGVAVEGQAKLHSRLVPSALTTLIERIFNTGGVSALVGNTYGAAKDVGVYVTGEAIRGLADLEAKE